MVLIIIKFGELSKHYECFEKLFIKHSKECFIRYPDSSKLFEKTRLHLVFSTHFSLFGHLHDETLFLVMIYYINQVCLLYVNYVQFHQFTYQVTF